MPRQEIAKNRMQNPQVAEKRIVGGEARAVRGLISLLLSLAVAAN